MTIQVKFFGATADLTGAREAAKTINDGDSAEDVIQTLIAEHPALAKHVLLVAVNEEYVSGTIRLNDGDELAIFTPVSGG